MPASSSAACSRSRQGPVRCRDWRGWGLGIGRGLCVAAGGLVDGAVGLRDGGGVELPPPKIGQRLFDRHQLAGLDQPQQADLQMQPRLQRELQILEQIERELQIARQVFFGKSAGDLGQPLLLRAATPRSAAYSRLPPSRPADCGNSAPARGRNAASCGRCAPAPSPGPASRRESSAVSACVTSPSESSENMPEQPRTSAASSFVPQQAMA